MKLIRIAVLTLMLLLGGAALASPASAQDDSGVSVTARAGFDSFYKSGRWIPVYVEVSNSGPDADVMVMAVVGRSLSEKNRYGQEISLPSGARKALTLYVPTSGFQSSVKVEVQRAGGQVIAEATALIDDVDMDDLLVAVWASNEAGFTPIADVRPVYGATILASLDAERVPAMFQALQSVDVLIVADVDTAELTDAQVLALEAWVAAGGRLIVATGPGWQKTSAGLAGLLPADVRGEAGLLSIDSLVALSTVSSEPEGMALLADLAPYARSQVLARSGDHPLIVGRRLGYGDVYVLAFDPGLAPLSDWAGMPDVYRSLLSNTADRPSWASAPRNWYNAAEAVEAIPGLKLPSLLLICGFLVSYVIIIGPVNFLVLRRMKRTELAWFSVPVLVVLFAGLAWLVGAGQRGNSPTVHRLAVVEAWEGVAQARVSGMVGVFSPTRTSYDLGLPEGTLASRIPEDYFGTVSNLSDVTFVQGVPGELRDMLVDVSELKAFTVAGFAEAPQVNSDLTMTVGGAVSRISGTVTNASDLTLTDAVLLAPGGVQQIGDIAGGATVDINLPLNSGRATQEVVQVTFPQVLPVGQVTPAVGSAGAYGYNYGYDSTVDDVLGTVAYSYYDDRESYRKYSLLTWVIESYGNSHRGTGTYLVGWSEEPLDGLGVAVQGRTFKHSDLTLYIFRLDTAMNIDAGGEMTIPPGLMSWRVLDPGASGNAGAYDVYLYDDYFSLRFKPLMPVVFDDVSALVLNFQSYGMSGIVENATVSLWDVAAEAWYPLEDLVYGGVQIAEPERFVRPDGSIDVLVEVNRANNAYGSVDISELDFTLVVER